MNYRHAYHAGNHTEIFKHSILAMLVEHLLKKPQPFMVLDTHAGIGLYDLESEEALRTGEKAGGAEKIFSTGIASSKRYMDLLHEMNDGELKIYPGSPEIVRRLLRDEDRLVACELHPADCATLAARYRRDARVTVHERSGYEAVKALLPPREKRGLVFIDPPFEARDEAQAMIGALSVGLRKWAGGIFCLWYPVKDDTIGDTLAAAVRAANYPKALKAEFRPFRKDNLSLSGSGVILCNAPWGISERIRALCADLVPLLGDRHASWSLAWLTDKNE